MHRADAAEAQRNEQQRVSDLLQGHSTKAEEHINQMVKELQQAQQHGDHKDRDIHTLREHCQNLEVLKFAPSECLSYSR